MFYAIMWQKRGDQLKIQLVFAVSIAVREKKLDTILLQITRKEMPGNTSNEPARFSCTSCRKKSRVQ